MSGFGVRAGVIASTLLIALAAGGLGASAQAATYTVGTTADPGGACASPVSGTCSLRQLVEYENALAVTPSPSDTIAVPSGEYQLKTGELVITQSLAIVGAGARTTHVVADSEFPERVFDIKVPGKGATPIVTISGLEISGGTANSSNGSLGGNVYNDGNLVLEEDWITGGTASSGGGVSNDTGTLRVERSLVSGNHASTGGGDSGGIQNHGSAVCGEDFCVPGQKAVLTVEDSTIADNDARLGAGIYSWSEAGVADGNEVSIIRSTIADNSTREESSGAALGEGAGLLVSDGTADVAGSILASNSATINAVFKNSNCATSGPGTIVSLGYNLETETDCGFKFTGDLQKTFPAFTSSTPQDNGGNTDTLAPKPTSPGVDAIPTSFLYCHGLDQRGVSRPQGAGCDTGAVELVPFTIESIEGSPFSGKLVTAECGISGTPTIEWGDGQKSEATVHEQTIGGNHTYAEEGTFNGSVSYADGDCGSQRFPFQAKIADAALSATGEAVGAAAGVQFSGRVAGFSDADPGRVASDYTASIDWGDGSVSAGTISSSGNGFAVSGSHTYASGGAYPINVTIADAGGAQASTIGSANVVSRPPAVSNISVVAVTETSATLEFTIDPGGADTSYVIDYGPGTGYGQHTEPVDVGAAAGPKRLAQTLTGLKPGSVYHFDVVTTNSQATAGVASEDQHFTTGGQSNPGQGVSAFQAAVKGPATLAILPPPVLGKTVNVDVVSGKVFVSLPASGYVSLAGGLQADLAAPLDALESLSKGFFFVPLTEARQIPVGSTLETTGGVVAIVTATATVGKTQYGEFGTGIFTLLQSRKQKGLTELDIIDNHSASQVCATLGKKAAVAAKHLSSKVLGRLTGTAHGGFTTRGQYSAATVRGTVWGVRNRCDGTLTKVTRGIVNVRDFRRRKTITLFAGQSYLAKAPGA